VQRQIEEGLESARRGELLDGEAVMQELRQLSAARRAAAKVRK
jgi:predicted transcriptional regulator